MSHKSPAACFVEFIYTAIILVFAWPLYLYLVTEWYAHRNHFVIRNRWPKISLVIVAFVIIVQIFCITESAFCLSILNPISLGMSNAIQGLVYYRAYLLYANTMKTREFRIVMTPVIAADKRTEACCNYRDVSRVLLCAILLASVLVTSCRYLNVAPPVYIVFAATLLLGITCLINIIRHKIKDSIGITKECVVQIAITFTMLVAVFFSTKMFPAFIKEINKAFGVVSNTLYGFATLFIAQNLLRKANVGKDIHSKSPTSTPAAGSTNGDPMRLASDSIADLHQAGLRIPKTTDSDIGNESMSSLPPLRNGRDVESLNKWLHKPLSVFLKHEQNNALFIGYLCECFALENMLFLERAIILHHLIRKYQQMDTEYAHAVNVKNTSDDEIKFEFVFAQPWYKLQFQHLTPIYNDIEAIIKESDETDGASGSMMYKRGIVKVMKLIYGQFCHRDSETEINIAFAIRDRLRTLFEVNTDEETLEQFTRYEGLLMVYHDAIEEIMRLCECIYGFRFKAYLRENAIKEEAGLSLALVEHDSAEKPKMEKIVEQTVQTKRISADFRK
eukprot:753785_1